MNNLFTILLLLTSISSFAIDGSHSGNYEELSWGEESGQCVVEVSTKKNGEINVLLDFDGRGGRDKYRVQTIAAIDESNGIKTYSLSRKAGGNPDISELCDYLDLCTSKDKNETVELNEENGKLISATLSIWPYGHYYECVIK